MALNKVYDGNEKNNRERPVPAATQPGVPLIIETRPAVTLTARGDATKTQVLADGTSITFANGGAGNLPGSATVAFDGTYEFAVTGVTTGTANGVEVFLINDGSLSLTNSGDDTHFGWTDYPRDYAKVASVAPVRIGA